MLPGCDLAEALSALVTVVCLREEILHVRHVQSGCGCSLFSIFATFAPAGAPPFGRRYRYRFFNHDRLIANCWWLGCCGWCCHDCLFFNCCWGLELGSSPGCLLCLWGLGPRSKVALAPGGRASWAFALTVGPFLAAVSIVENWAVIVDLIQLLVEAPKLLLLGIAPNP